MARGGKREPAASGDEGAARVYKRPAPVMFVYVYSKRSSRRKKGEKR